jgi:hypothetical protein
LLLLLEIEQIFRLDVQNANGGLAPREYFEELLRKRQEARNPPVPVKYVMNPVNVDRNSFSLVAVDESVEENSAPLGKDGTRYRLKFLFDTLRPCSIRLHWGVPANVIDEKLFGISKKGTEANESEIDGEALPVREEEEGLIRRGSRRRAIEIRIWRTRNGTGNLKSSCL